MKDIMVDLETMGTGSDAPIISIGAVKFGPKGLGDEFYKIINLTSNEHYGRKYGGDTILWWLKQSDDARKALYDADCSLFDALKQFSKFCGEDSRVWGNGATFDNVILSNAYEAANLPRPWAFWNDMCYRTVKNLVGKEGYTPPETAHDALQDAKAQAAHLRIMLKKIKGALQ